MQERIRRQNSPKRAGTNLARRRRGFQPERLREAVGSEAGRFVAFCIFLAMVALTGGGSRSDILSLVILRPFAILATLYGLWFVVREDLKDVKVPLSVVIGFMIIAALQLIPLPWSIWTELPGRAAIAKIDTLLGLTGSARPLSLEPAKTWNTFFALFVPFAAIVLFAIQAERYRRKSLIALAGVALASAAIGYLQAIGLKALHFYAITHDNHPVGLFANKNHQAVFLAWLLMTIAFFATWIEPTSRKAKAHTATVLGMMLVIFPLILLSGSRAGLLTSFPALLISLWLLSRAPVFQPSAKKQKKAKQTRIVFVSIGIVVLFAGIFSVLALSDRQAALSRLFETDPADEMRWIVLPLIWKMTSDFFVTGIGFGAFAEVFHMYEPVETLTPGYLNQAHLDPLQLVIEGGIPALLLALWGLVWTASRIFGLWFAGNRSARDAAIYLLAAIGVWLAASLIDYPIRTPIVSVVFAVLTAYLGVSSVRANRGTVRYPSDSTSQGKQ